MDIAAHIIAAGFRLRAQEYRVMLAEMGRAGVVEVAFAQRLASTVGFRKSIFHDYPQVDAILALLPHPETGVG